MSAKIAINLMPPDRKAALRTGYVFAYAQTMVALFFLLTVIAAGTLFSVKLMVQSVRDDLAQRSTETTDEFKQLSADIKAINAYLTGTEAYLAKSQAWSGVLRTVTDLAPAGTRIERIAVEADGNITVGGTAETRAALLEYAERLRRDGSFTDVRSPISNILQQRDVRFEFEMVLAAAKP